MKSRIKSLWFISMALLITFSNVPESGADLFVDGILTVGGEVNGNNYELSTTGWWTNVGSSGELNETGPAYANYPPPVASPSSPWPSPFVSGYADSGSLSLGTLATAVTADRKGAIISEFGNKVIVGAGTSGLNVGDAITLTFQFRMDGATSVNSDKNTQDSDATVSANFTYQIWDPTQWDIDYSPYLFDFGGNIWNQETTTNSLGDRDQNYYYSWRAEEDGVEVYSDWLPSNITTLGFNQSKTCLPSLDNPSCNTIFDTGLLEISINTYIGAELYIYGWQQSISEVTGATGHAYNNFLNTMGGTLTAPVGVELSYALQPAAVIGIPKTTQTLCYNEAGDEISCVGTGQDGETQAGTAWPSPRFTDNGDGTLTDDLTGLIWLKNIDCLGYALWADAPTLAATLSNGNVACGLTDGSTAGDWRIPNIVEFLSLYNHTPPTSSYTDWFVDQGFININTTSDFWTSSSSRWNATGAAAWAITLRFGNPKNYYNKGNTAHLWPVRGGQIDGNPDTTYPANLWKTGQLIGGSLTASNTDSNILVAAGVAWPSPRFTDNGDGTITDNLTDIVWLKQADCFTQDTWQNALNAVSSLANGACGLTDGTVAGEWRLPNGNELSTLVDYGRRLPALPSDHLFTNVRSLDHWSSTTSFSPNAADTVDLGYGTNYVTNKANALPFLPVRTVPGSTAAEITVTDSVAPITDLSIIFGGITEQTSADQTVTITNDGTADLVLGNIAITNSLSPPFSILNDLCSGQTLVPAANCTFAIRFAPTTTGLFSDSLDIPSNDPDEDPVTFSVSGTGQSSTVPDITVTDSVAPNNDLQVPFGSFTIGASTNQTLTITNSGNGDLVLGAIATANPIVAPFSIQNNTCDGQTLTPASSCDFDVRFAPTADGVFNESLDIPSNDPDEDPVTISVSGTGTAIPVPDITVTDTMVPLDDLQVPFGDVTEGLSTYQTVTLSNDGNADLVIGDIAVANPVADPFAIFNDTCSGQTLLPTTDCTFDVSFTPIDTSTSNDSFDVPSNDPDEGSLTINLSGTGLSSVTNNSPGKPQLVFPANGQEQIETNVTFRWRPVSDPDGDPVSYDVFYCTDADPFQSCEAVQVTSFNGQNIGGRPSGNIYYAGIGSGVVMLFFGVSFVGRLRGRKKIALLIAMTITIGGLLMACGSSSGSSNSNDETFAVEGLDSGTQYYWGVVAKDGQGGQTQSDVWRFTTR